MSQKFIEGRIVGRKDHTSTLFSLQFEAPLAGFIAGQYCQVGLKLPVGGEPASGASNCSENNVRV